MRPSYVTQSIYMAGRPMTPLERKQADMMSSALPGTSFKPPADPPRVPKSSSAGGGGPAPASRAAAQQSTAMAFGNSFQGVAPPPAPPGSEKFVATSKEAQGRSASTLESNARGGLSLSHRTWALPPAQSRPVSPNSTTRGLVKPSR